VIASAWRIPGNVGAAHAFKAIEPKEIRRGICQLAIALESELKADGISLLDQALTSG
jgi:hypothetical protein